MELIDKAAVVAEIERRIYTYKNVCGTDRRTDALISLKNYLDTLEVKEVDLEKDVDKILEENDWDYDEIDFYDFAKHFFELGLKAMEE